MLRSESQLGLNRLPIESPAGVGQRQGSFSGRVAFVMPRCSHEHVRGVHKQALTLSRAGYAVDLLVRPSDVQDYYGMRVVSACTGSTSSARSILSAPRLLAQILRMRADVYVLRNPDSIPLAFMLHWLGKRVVYDTQEDFSLRPLIRDRIPRRLRPLAARIITRLERILARTLPCVIVTQAQQLESLGGRALLLPNAPLVTGPVYDEIEETNGDRHGDALRLIYAGEISRRRGLITMLDLVESLNAPQHCRRRLLGSFVSRALFEEAIRHPGWQYVDYRGQVTHAEALSSMRDADVGLALLEPVADFPTSSITKLYEYMEAGLPFLASDFPAWRVGRTPHLPGVYVDPTSFDEVRDAAIAVAKDPHRRRRMGRVGKSYIANEFNWDLQVPPFLDLIESLCRGTACAAKPTT